MLVYLAVIGSRGLYDSQHGDVDLVAFDMMPPRDYRMIRTDTVNSQRQVNEFDIVRKDVKNVLLLMLKSNVSVYEWLMTPVRLYETRIVEDMRWVAQHCFNRRLMYAHYRGFAVAHVLKQDAKKLRYARKGVCAMRDILEGRMPDVTMHECDLKEEFVEAELDKLPPRIPGCPGSCDLYREVNGIWQKVLNGEYYGDVL